MKVTIIYGGKSAEHEVSLRSATSVLKNLDKDDEVLLIGIAKESGKWYWQESSIIEEILENDDKLLYIKEDEENLVSVLPGGGRKAFSVSGRESFTTDVVFPVLHGTYGEDGSIQGLLEMIDIPYVGPSVLASSIAMDKEKAKILWQVAGLNVVPYMSVKKRSWTTDDKRLSIILKSETEFAYPMFVKPCSLGSSVGTSKVTNREELHIAIEKAFEWDDKILIEKFIEAREIECSVTGYNEVTVYTAGEIIPHHDFYDYEAKYIDSKGATLKIPADLDDGTCKKIRELAGKAYEALSLSSLSRIDFLMDKNNNAIYLNEANTIPGFTSISMFPKLCEAAGLPYKDLIKMLLKEAIENKTFKHSHSLQNT